MTDLTMGQRIAECRKKLGLSQEALGEKVGVSRQAISKWEADGAVPEIDKLIALSKLFNVSVGWLLGVEEAPAALEEKAEISEELLRKIEEIVLRYRPRKQPMSTKKKVLIGITAVLILWGIGTFAGHWSRLTLNVATVSSQTRTNNEQNARIMEQLAALESRMEEPESPLLSSYKFEIFPMYSIAEKEANGAEVKLIAVPTVWKEGDTGILSVRHSTLGTIQKECQWDGSFLTASVSLEEAYGYELCFTIRHADGTQEQQALQDEAVEALRSTLTIPITSARGGGHFELDGTDLKLTLIDYSVYVERPAIAQKYDTWDTLEYILYLNRGGEREVIGTYDLLGPVSEGDDILRAATIQTYGDRPVFILPGALEGDGLELWVNVKMSNGMSNMTVVDCWAYMDGAFNNFSPTGVE